MESTKCYWWTHLQGRGRDVENGRVDTRQEDKGGMNWENSIDIYVHDHV